MNPGRSGPSLRERQREQTRVHLLAVATELIGTQGFNATSIDDIAKAAGASRATVYSYFESKDAILAELVHTMWEDADSMYREFGELPDWSRPGVKAWITGVVARWEAHQLRNRAAVEVGSRSLHQQQGPYLERYVENLTLNEELWTARFSRPEARRRASMLISLLESYMSKWFITGIAVERKAAIDTLTDVWLDVLHARD